MIGTAESIFYHRDMNRDILAGDPFVLFDEKSQSFYVYATLEQGSERGWAFAIYKSKNLTDFSFLGYAYEMRKSTIGRDWFWAPEVYYSPHNGYYFMFYSCRVRKELNAFYFGDENFEEGCKICVAYSRSPEGPFIDFPDPALDFFPYDPTYRNIDGKLENYDEPIDDKECSIGTFIPLIDANVLIDDRSIYLYASLNCYRNIHFDHSLNRYVESSEIVGVELETDWYFSDKLVKPAVKSAYKHVYGQNKDGYREILSYRQEPQEWENFNVSDFRKFRRHNRRWCEGSFILPRVENQRKVYYLYYSANCYQEENYDLGVAVSSSPLGPFAKFRGNPIGPKPNVYDICSIGHCSFTMRNQKYLCCFHGRKKIDQPRILCFAELDDDMKRMEMLPLPSI